MSTTSDPAADKAQTDDLGTPPRPPHKDSNIVSPLFHPHNSIMDDAAVTRSMRAYDIKLMPVKKQMLRGHMVPTVKSAFGGLAGGKTRRISIEIHGPASEQEKNNGSPIKQTLMQKLLDGEKVSQTDLKNETLQEKDIVYIRFLKHKNRRDIARNKVDASDDDSTEDPKADGSRSVVSMSTLGIIGADDSDDENAVWVENARYRFDDIKLVERRGRSCELKFGAGNDATIRDIKFDSENDSTAFESLYEIMTKLQQERTMRKVAQYKGGNKDLALPTFKKKDLHGDVDDDDEDGAEERIAILVDIVSCDDLPVADLLSTDPYIIVRMGGAEIHRTQFIPNDLNPIFTVEHGSIFVVDMSPEKFFSATSGMQFMVKDYDAFGANETLGKATVPLNDLLRGTGDRKDYKIVPDKATQYKDSKAKINLRFRPATLQDVEFTEVLRKNKKGVGIYLDETFVPPRAPTSKLFKRQGRSGLDRAKLLRTKPFPDPDRNEDETKWLTREQLDEEARKPSTSWLETGSGDLGHLYVEIIGCDDLPNMDALSLNVRDKTDAFVNMVFEDVIVNTDVIGDSCSPRWPHWCRRAFAFNISHPSSQIFLGVFDYDPPMSPLQMASSAASFSLHDPIARCLIHVSSFLPDTEYTLTYPLYYGETKEHRQKTRGTITLRLRVEWVNARQAMIAGIAPPAPSYVACDKGHDFGVAHYTCDGIQDWTKFSMDMFTKHIEELQTYAELMEYIKPALLVVWLWRGHHKVKVFGTTFNLPLHSMTAFTWGVLLSWDFNMFPSFLLFLIGWIFVACNEYTLRHPSPWHRSRPYFAMLLPVVLGMTLTERINENENIDAIEAYEKKQKEAAERRAKERELEMKHQEQMQKELGDDAGEDTDITSKSTSILPFNVNPLKPMLHPVQLQLGGAVATLRIVSSIIQWQETHYAFWITTFSFLGSLVLIWVPWGWLLRWILRLTVFFVLGPWMAIVDRLYFAKDPNMTEEEHEKIVRERLKGQTKLMLATATGHQVRKERAVKLKAMKKFMFGKFLIKVPRFCEDLFADIPTSQSKAVPWDPTKSPPVQIKERTYGQILRGDMIPRREIQEAENRKAEEKARSKGALQSITGAPGMMAGTAGNAAGRFAGNTFGLAGRAIGGTANTADKMAEGTMGVAGNAVGGVVGTAGNAAEKVPLLGRFARSGRSERKGRSETYQSMASAGTEATPPQTK